MVGQTTLALSALVVLAQSKAIVTNLCSHDIFVWSVPETAHVAKDLAIKSGKSYVEPFRSGTATNPGIAIKISPRKNGINEGKDEIDFAYTVDKFDSNKVWINLSNVRGKAFEDNVALLTCHGPYKGPFVPTRQCTNHDDIELILCGTEHAAPKAPEYDYSHPHGISNCSVPQTGHGEQARAYRSRQCSPRLIDSNQTSKHPASDKDDVQHSKKASQPMDPIGDPDSIVRDLCTLIEYGGTACDAKVLRKHWYHVLELVCKQTSPHDTLGQCVLILHGAAEFIREGHAILSPFSLGRIQVQSRSSAKSDWSYRQACQSLARISNTGPTPGNPIGFDCDKIIHDLSTKFKGKNPTVNIGWYVDQRLPRAGRHQVESAFDKYFDQINWSDSSGSGTEYGWHGPSKNVQARRPKRSYKETCDLLLKMFGGYDCKKRAVELKDAAKRFHPSKSNPDVHIGQRFQLTGMAADRRERRHLRKDLKKYFTEVSWSDSTGSGTPYGRGHETKRLSTRAEPKVSYEVACGWIFKLFPEKRIGIPFDCEAIANKFESERKVYIGKPVKKFLPEVRPTDVEKVFDYYWPAVEWSDDES